MNDSDWLVWTNWGTWYVAMMLSDLEPEDRGRSAEEIRDFVDDCLVVSCVMNQDSYLRLLLADAECDYEQVACVLQRN